MLNTRLQHESGIETTCVMYIIITQQQCDKKLKTKLATEWKVKLSKHNPTIEQ